MAGLAKSTNKRVQIIKVKDKKDFLDAFNRSHPSPDMLELSRKAWELFGETDSSISRDIRSKTDAV